MFNYNFNIEKSIIRNLISSLKNNYTLTWLRVLLHPTRLLHDDFIAEHKRIDYELSFNASKIYLEHILNDTFDPVNRAIYINNTGAIPQVYIYNIAEGQPPLYIADYNQNQIVYIGNYANYSDVLFTVFVPNTVVFNQARMKAIINRYRNTKLYNIVTY